MRIRTTRTCSTCRTRICGAPVRRRCRSFPPRQARPRPWAKCCPRGRAGWTASRGAGRRRTGRGGGLVGVLEKKVTADEVNAALEAAADGPMKGILQFSTDPLVSIDFRGNPRSSIVDAAYTKVMDGDFVKVLAWYDNEWGYSNRCVDLLKIL